MKSILTQEQSNELNRCKKQITYCALPGNIPKVASYIPFKDEMDLLIGQVSLIEGTEADKAVSGKDATKGKANLKHAFAEFEGTICLEALAYAIKYGKPIESIVKIRVDEIFGLKDGDIVGFSNLIKDTVGPYITDMNLKFYTTTAADLDTGVTMAGDFAATIGQAGVITGGGTVAAGEIEAAFTTIAEIQDQLFLLKNHWKISDHSFYEGFIISSVIIDAGHVFTGMKGVITGGPSDILLGGATVTNERTGKSATADVLGYYIMQGMHAHLDNFRVSSVGRPDLIVPIKTLYRETMVMNFHMA